MGKVVTLIKIMPKENNVIKEIVRKLNIEFELKDYREVEVAYGIKALEVAIILEDAEGEMQRLEDFLGNMDEVSTFDVVDISLL
jgi:translation elongation factor aEF-1 beta